MFNLSNVYLAVDGSSKSGTTITCGWSITENLIAKFPFQGPRFRVEQFISCAVSPDNLELAIHSSDDITSCIEGSHPLFFAFIEFFCSLFPFFNLPAEFENRLFKIRSRGLKFVY